MNLVLLVSGTALLVVTAIDVGVTTLTFNIGRSSVSNRLVGLGWTASRRVLRGRHAALSMVGPVLLSLLALWWITMVWLGWSLVFIASADALVETETGLPASHWDAVYFAGYTITTLGVGHLATVGDSWQIAEVLASMSGFVLASLGISFVISVVDAVVDKRSLAADLHALGATPDDVVRHAEDIRPAVARAVLAEASSRLHHLAQQHLAYPVLHYFHSSDRRTALAPSLAVVDEAVGIVRGRTTDWADPWTWTRWGHARTVFLGTLHGTFVEPAGQPPDRPDPALEERRVGDEEVGRDEDASDDERRRALLVAFTSQHGWDWDTDVLGES